MKQNKSAKRSLIFSVLSLLLCCAMLVGTTFAWFTDSVTSGNNKIVAGNLDVELYHSSATVTDEKVTENTLLFVQQLWEPGVAVFENFEVANEGTLALKYQLMVNFTNAVKTPSGKTLADILKVGVVEGGVSGDRDAVVGAVQTWEPLATFVLNGDLMATESDVYGIVIWWEPSDIDDEFNMKNENKGTVLSIDLGVSLIATQIDAESDSFGKDYDAGTTLPELIEDNAELKDALTADVKDIVVTLTNDVTWDVAAWAQNAMGGASTETITINGNGYTINFNQTNSDWNNITAGDGIVLTINDAKVTNSGYNDGPWNRHDLNFACEVVMNNVTSDKAMAFKNSATLNNVTIDDANTSDTYAIWVSPRTEGQTITLNNCVIDMLDCTDGRGIKIDNQYVNAADEKLVTLNVSNTTFKTEEKSAILVKTTKGAKVNLSNVDIAKTLDPLHAVWVDDAAAAAYDLVTVTGGEKVLESDIVSSTTDLGKAIEAGETELQLVAGTYTIPSAVAGKEITIEGVGDDTVIDFTKANGINGASITFKNLKIQGKNANVMSGFGIQGTTGHIAYEDCTFDGAVTNEYYGSVSYKNCTFTGTGYITTYAVKSATFENCVFDKADSRAVLVYSHGDNPCEVTLTDCEFKAAAKGYTGAGAWTAAVEVDTTNIKTAGTTVTIKNCTADANYSGIVRDKSSATATPAVIVVDGSYVAGTDAALKNILMGRNEKNITVGLIADLSLPAAHSNNLGGVDTETVTINGNGHKLTLTTTYMPGFWMNNDAGKLIINDATITTTRESGTWDVYDITFNNNTELKNVKFEKAVALSGVGNTFVLNNVSITETNDYYALWISANGANVTIDGLNIESAGRGIKVDDEYQGANVAKVTLSVSDATFKTNKKAAIMVCTSAGADITLENVDISKVAADTTNVVWNDSDAAAHMNKITVTGGTIAQEQ